MRSRLFLLFAFFVFAAFQTQAAPSITSLSPTSGAVGASVTITGSGFGNSQGSSTVKFNNTAATTTGWTSTSITATVPTGATTGNVVVTVSGSASNGKSFTVVAAPSITSLSPTSAAVGTSITVTGTGFGTTQGSGTVSFNGTQGTPTSWNSTTIKVPVPTGATTGNVVVHTSGVNSNGKAFTVLPTPNISGLSTTSGVVGTAVTISGTNFGSPQGSSTVKFNGTTATTTTWTNTSIATTVPTGASSGNIVVTVSGVPSNGVAFTVYVTPSITSLSPTSGAIGTSVTVTGSGFQSTQGTSSVTFNGVPATPTSWNSTQIKAPVPAGAATGNVFVITGGLSSNAKTFTVVPTPTITSVSSSFGAVGVPITIVGTNFGRTQGSSTVKFNGTTATPSTWNATQIVVPVPSGASNGSLIVHTSGIDVSGGTFTVETPTAIAVTPATATLPINSIQQMHAIATYADGKNQDVAAAATWSSTVTSVATITSTGLLTGVAQGQTSISATFASLNNSTALTIGPSPFIPVGGPLTERTLYTATRLPDGRVLIAGGENSSGNVLGSAEIYDPATQTFTATGRMTTPRAEHTATLLPNGQVLIAGGVYFDTNFNNFTTLASAELYDPSTGVFTATSLPMNQGRDSHTATLLNNGTVVIVGGILFTPGVGDSAADNEIYDPVAGTFTATGASLVPRDSHTANLLKDGTVLIAGGESPAGLPLTPNAEVYDPVAQTFSGVGNMLIANLEHDTATLLNSGQVLVAGGVCFSCNSTNTTEVYDPVAKTFSAGINMSVARSFQTATPLNTGTVLIVGGDASATTGTAEIYDPVAQTFTAAGALQNACGGSTATLMKDGTVLIVGGTGTTACSEVYSPTPLAPLSLQVTPSTANMIVGDTQQFTVVSNFGYPRNDATWAVSDPSLASITSDSSPTVTALAAGTVTVTATINGVSGQAQITISPTGTALTPGTPVWTVPPVPGFAPTQMAQAMPSDAQASMFSIQSNSAGTQSVIQAFTDDGQQVWQNTFPVLNGKSVPDGNGGIIVVENQTCKTNQTDAMMIVDVDGTSGQPIWQIQAAAVNGLYCYTETPLMALRADGSIAITNPSNTSGLPEFMIVNGQNGQGVLVPTIPPSQYDGNLGGSVFGYSPIGAPIVDADGATYVEYEVRHIASSFQIVSANLYLMEVAPDSTITTVQLSSTTQDENLFPGPIIPDGQGGVLATWSIQVDTAPKPANPYQAVDVIGGVAGIPYNLPFTPNTEAQLPDGLPLPPSFVLGENGVAFATDGRSSGDSTNGLGPKIVSFNPASGALNWTYQVNTQDTLSIIGATNDGGVIIVDDSNLTQLDDNGAASVIALNAPGLQNSWTGNWYGMPTGSTQQIALPPIRWAVTYASMLGGNPAQTGEFVGVGVPIEGVPIFGLGSKGSQCTLPKDPAARQKVPLGGVALAQYNGFKQALLSSGALTCPSCTSFFNSDIFRQVYFGQLTSAVTNQVPYDGFKTNISQYDAGFSDGKIPIDVKIKQMVPVCAAFAPFHGPNGTATPRGVATATSQIAPPAGGSATDTYISTLPKALQRLSQGTILHEALHNLTGLYDFLSLKMQLDYNYSQPADLKTLLGLETSIGVDPDPNGSTIDITRILEANNCATQN